jgi:alkaline phosphatase D
VKRRDFLRLTAASLVAGCATRGANGPDAGADDGLAPADGADIDAAPPPPPPMTRDLGAISKSTAFALGVMAGDALEDRAVLWTKYGGTRALAIYVQVEDGPAVAEASVSVEDGAFVHVEIDGLIAGTRYQYAFLEKTGGGDVVARSAIGRIKTAIASDSLVPVAFAGVSCTSQQVAATNANMLRLAGRTDLDFMLHLGDHLYADFPSDVPDAAMDLAGFRGKYAYAWARPGLTAVHATHGMYNTIDDHEIYNNWGGYNPGNPRIVDGMRAFFEHNPIRRNTSDPLRIWRSIKWGRTLEVFVLDCRSERAPGAGRYLSEAQLAWLTTGLQQSQAVFKFVVSSCPIGLFPSTIGAWRSSTDRWANPAYAAQRAQVLDAAEQVGGVWWLSGDFHFGCIGRVQYPDTTRYPRQREVLMGAGGQGIGSSTAIPGATRQAQVTALDDNSHWTFSTYKNNYVVIRAHPEADATHPTPYLEIAYYDSTAQLHYATYQLL